MCMCTTHVFEERILNCVCFVHVCISRLIDLELSKAMVQAVAIVNIDSGYICIPVDFQLLAINMRTLSTSKPGCAAVETNRAGLIMGQSTHAQF